METSKHHSNSKQRHEHRHIIETHLTSLSDSKNTGEDTTPVHHKPHPTYLHATRAQRQPQHMQSELAKNGNVYKKGRPCKIWHP